MDTGRHRHLSATDKTPYEISARIRMVALLISGTFKKALLKDVRNFKNFVEVEINIA